MFIIIVEQVNTHAYGAGSPEDIIMARKNALNPDDWIKAGFRALSAGGSQALKAEAIAKALQVSKGSFYWHFKDVPALKASMLEHWKEVATNDIIAQINDKGDEGIGPKDQLRLLVQVATDINRSEPYGGVLAEAAIRDWARYDDKASAALKSVDVIRLKFLEGLFEKCGIEPARCHFCANILYATLIGLQHLLESRTTDQQNHLPELLELLFSQK